MPKRMIHSSIFSNEDFGDIGAGSVEKLRRRLLFIGIFSLADDEGRINGSAKFLKASVFPYDDDIKVKDVEKDILFMFKKGMYTLYEVEGRPFIQNKNWDKWQYIRRDLFKPSTIPSPQKGKISDIEQDNESIEDTPQRKSKGKHPFDIDEINDVVCYEISEAYNVDLKYVKSKREALRLYCGSNAKQYADYKLTLMNWIRRDIEEGKAKKKVITNNYVPEKVPEMTPEQRERSQKIIDKMRKELADKLSKS